MRLQPRHVFSDKLFILRNKEEEDDDDGDDDADKKNYSLPQSVLFVWDYRSAAKDVLLHTLIIMAFRFA